eukprot:TRINITY_DN517_c0_g1_i1.p1 TRINITY_DN517_c0_g1~~TRINITY_DN517_c0_g1_i1.p1  ORF type:complete len:182 (+),score=79.09 TRINITY_DN517_c0_g1_i1:171-716(+)
MTDTEYGPEVLFAAAKRNNISLMKEYIAQKGKNFDPNIIDPLGSTPLHYSAGSNYKEGLEILLSKAANPNIKNATSGETPLHRAIWGGHIDAVRKLIEMGADATIPNANKQTPLQLAKSKEMKSLIESAVAAKRFDDDDVASEDEDDTKPPQPPARPTRKQPAPPKKAEVDRDMIADDDDD